VNEHHHVTVYDRCAPEEARALSELMASGRVWAVRDTLDQQLRDLVRSRNPRRVPLTAHECAPMVEALLGGVPLESWGRWVWYPWSGELVHLLPPAEFHELRTDRNRYKLTADEQATLRQLTVGIAGLSVGNVVASTLALEGVVGCLRLADFDTLELSNLNRIRAGTHQLGLHKTVLAARQLAELDPYLRVECFHDGVTAANMDAFLSGLDLLIDECDGIAVKFELRRRARAARVAVVMETSDRGLLDVERFDLEPDRPSFHGLVDDVSAADLVGIDTERKATLMMKIIGADTTSARACASMMEIDRTISAWPQLASDVTLGGATVTTVVRRLGLGRAVPSGRRWVDLERIVAGEPAADPAAAAARPPPLPARGAAAPSPITQVPEHVRFVVEHAALAPSGANCQPWRFWWDGDALELHHDRVRSRNHLDRTHHASWLAFGAALENLSIAASHRGFVAESTVGRGERIARVALRPALVAADPRLQLVTRRATHRSRCERRPLAEEDQAALRLAAAGVTVELATDDAALRELGALLGAADRVRCLHPELHREMMGEVRWTRAEAERTRDGLDLELLALSPFQRAALGVTARVDVAEEARRLARGAALEEHARDAVRDSSAVGLIHFGGGGLAEWLEVGRATQRLWLEATARQLGLHPWTALTYLFDQLDAEGSLFDADEARAVAALRTRLHRVFPGLEGRAPAFLFRLTHGGPPEARSLRLPLDHVLGVRPPA
jgi:molybdopterin/thiamine biosynthesis adenylyltransferase